VRITLWPKLEKVPFYEGRKIEVEAPVVDDDALEEQIDRFRSQFAELEDVERAADDGDFVMINLSASRDGEAIEEASAEDLLYGIGSNAYLPGLDDLLVGVNPGDIKEGSSTLPDGFGDLGGEDVDIKVLVKGVRGRKLPEVTDEWVSDVSEFESVDDLTTQLRTNMKLMKLSEATNAFQESLLSELVEDADVELPEPLVEAEMEARVHNMAHALEEQGIDFANYLRITGQDQEAFSKEVREQASRNLKTQLLLDAVIADEGFEVEEQDLNEAIAELAVQAGQEPAAVRATLEASGQVESLTGDILRRKALERLIEGATAVDGDGNEVDLAPPEIVDDTDLDADETDADDNDEAAIEAADVDSDAEETSAVDVKDSDDGADNETE
jgi:trigger factor